MNSFDKQHEMFCESNKAFNRYKKIVCKELDVPEEIVRGYIKKGKELLSKEKINYFLEIRSIYYLNVVEMNLSEYNLFEWSVCLHEKVLLDYAIPVFYKVLKKYPMLCGDKCNWQILYEITQIDDCFWNKYTYWYELFSGIYLNVINLNDNTDYPISKEFLEKFKNF